MKLSFEGVACWAARMRSPSFSRRGLSSAMMNSPRAMGHVRNGLSFEGAKGMVRTECFYGILNAVKGVVMAGAVGVFGGSVDAVHDRRHFGVRICVRHGYR